MQERTPVAAPPPSVVAQTTAAMDGLTQAQVDAIRAAIQSQQKFLGSLVEHVTRWELAAGEIRLYFPHENKALADMLQARDPMEKLRSITSQVIGQSLRVCVKLENVAAAQTPAPKRKESGRGSMELRAQFEDDPIVRAMLERFGGQISEVRKPDEEE